MKMLLCDGCGTPLDVAARTSSLFTVTAIVPTTINGYDYSLDRNEDHKLKFEVCPTCREKMLCIGMKFLHNQRRNAA